MQFLETNIEGLFEFRPKVYQDVRGYFYESFSQKEFDMFLADNHLSPTIFVQHNQVYSCYGVIRAFGLQQGEHAQSKLIECINGRILDVVIDLRRMSKSFGNVFKTILSGKEHNQLFIPKGCAHGYSVLSKEAIVQFKVDEYYQPYSELSFRWNDPDINIDWQIPQSEIIVTDRDNNAPMFKELIFQIK